ncbi:hypothetical protein WJ68_05640 [Burkholderia ubonensis]|uniref:EthD domain-containing protein n=1 Tax=Burkholderia ubonensis TaxID=101571 RepID=A0ABD4E757_9BURK|nr:hypothetical protein WJ68_05640 [Burkholderia ubonensis]
MHAGYPFDSVTYRSVVGGPLLLWLIALKDFSALEDVGAAGKANKAVPAGAAAAVESYSGSVLRYLPQASHPAANPQDPPYLLYVQAKLHPVAGLNGGRELLQELAGHHALGLVDYVYESVAGGPTLDWFVSIENLGRLENLGDPVSAIKAKGGDKLLKSIAPHIAKISSTLLRKEA